MNKEKILLNSDLDYYGASNVIAEYCGLEHPFFLPKVISWQHGWMPEYFNVHPYRILGTVDSDRRDYTYLVARKDQAEFLSMHGYPEVYAVGMPIIYVPPKKFKRKKNSLLVMPVHSMPYTSHDHWQFDEYVNEILHLKDYFDEITICIHPSCFDKGYWVNEFSHFGFSIIEGASIDDKNAFYRLQEIFSSYEYVTTNGFGSHIAYAAYFGAKVSLFGSFPEFRKEDYSKDPFFQKFPELFDYDLLSKEKVYRFLKDFAVHPKDAIQQIDWGKNQLGYGNKLSPKQFLYVLGYYQKLPFMTRVKNYVRRFSLLAD